MDADYVKKLKEHPLPFHLAVILAAFLMGFGARESVIRLMEQDLVPRGSYVFKKDVITPSDYEGLRRERDQGNQDIAKLRQQLQDFQDDHKANWVRIKALPLQVQGNQETCIKAIRELCSGSLSLDIDRLSQLFVSMEAYKRKNNVIPTNPDRSQKTDRWIAFMANLSEFLSMISPAYPQQPVSSTRTIEEKVRQFQLACGERSVDGIIASVTWGHVEQAYQVVRQDFNDKRVHTSESWKNRIQTVLFSSRAPVPQSTILR